MDKTHQFSTHYVIL